MEGSGRGLISLALRQPIQFGQSTGHRTPAETRVAKLGLGPARRRTRRRQLITPLRIDQEGVPSLSRTHLQDLLIHVPLLKPIFFADFFKGLARYRVSLMHVSGVSCYDPGSVIRPDLKSRKMDILSPRRFREPVYVRHHEFDFFIFFSHPSNTLLSSNS